MNSKKEALEELLQGFLQKFGDSSRNRAIISEEISQFMKTREKISIRDIDELEELLLYKLRPSKQVFSKRSLSPIETRYTKDLSLFQLDKPIGCKSTTRDMSAKNTPFPISIFKSKQPIQPSPLSFLAVTQGKISSPLKSLTPSRKLIMNHYDDWGKIFRAEAIKHRKDQELSIKQQKSAKLDYSTQLYKQIEETNRKKDILRSEREVDREIIGKNTQEFLNLKDNLKKKKNEYIVQQRNEYLRAVEMKQYKIASHLELRKIDKDELDKTTAMFDHEERKKAAEKERIAKEVELENIKNAKIKEFEKYERLAIDSKNELLHLEKVEKDLSENENKHRQLITSKAELAHNEERLLKIIQTKQKSLKDYENEADKQEKELVLKTIQEETENQRKKKIAEIKNKVEVAGFLSSQMRENELKREKFKEWVKEQGDIWKQEDDKTHEKIRESKLAKKLHQQHMKKILDTQVKEKEAQMLNTLQLSPIESKLNKNIWNSAIKLLSEEATEA